MALSPIGRSAHFRIGDRSIVVFAGDMFSSRSLPGWEGGRKGGRQTDRRRNIISPPFGAKFGSPHARVLLRATHFRHPLERASPSPCLTTTGKYVSEANSSLYFPTSARCPISLSLSVDLIPRRTCIQLTDDCCCPYLNFKASAI